jgi:hypothetical protein
MTIPRIQALESLSFEWKASFVRRKGMPNKTSPDDDAKSVHERVVEAPEHTQQQHSLKTISVVEESAAIKSTSLSKPMNPCGLAKST